MPLNSTSTVFLDRFKLKNIAEHEALDGFYMRANVYFDGKLVGEFIDEGDGSEPRAMDFSHPAGQAFKEFVMNSGIREHMAKEGYGDNPSELTVMGYIVASHFELRAQKKVIQAHQRQAKKSLVMVFDDGRQSFKYGWKKIKSLNELVALKGGLAALQKSYDQAIGDAKKENGKLINDPNELTKLGVTVDTRYHSA